MMAPASEPGLQGARIETLELVLEADRTGASIGIYVPHELIADFLDALRQGEYRPVDLSLILEVHGERVELSSMRLIAVD